jgi:hypothetical protein
MMENPLRLLPPGRRERAGLSLARKRDRYRVGPDFRSKLEMKVQKLFIELHTSRLLDVAVPYRFNVKTIF